jgi:hypothetical protein
MRQLLILAAALTLAAGAGYLTSQAVGVGSQTPARTVTINVATGPQGPAGPQGPPGPAGSSSCPTGFEAGELVINHPGGQTAIWTCLKTP